LTAIRSDVRFGGEQVGGDLGQGFGYLAVDVGLAGVLGLEGVEDAVVGVVELERVPRDGSLLGQRQRASALQECPQLIALAGLCLELCE
jgi:hypothetical protein